MTQANLYDILQGLDNYDPSKQKENTLTQVTKLAMYVDTLQAYLDLQSLLQSATRYHEIPHVDALDQHGRAPLHWIVGQNYKAGCECLLQEQANINVLTKKEKFTPLMVACRKGGCAKVVDYLLKHRANHTLTAKSSATAFHIAVASGSRNCMRLLILHGANPFLPLSDGRTAIDLASNEKMRSLIYSCYRSAVIHREKLERPCAFCRKKVKTLKRCGKCYVTLYCSHNCQLDHWTMEHFEKCPGSVTTNVTDFQSKTALNKIKPEKMFIFKVVNISNDKVFFENEPQTVRATIDLDVYHKRGVLPSQLNADVVSHYWAKFTDAAKQEINIYLGSTLPRITYLIKN